MIGPISRAKTAVATQQFGDVNVRQLYDGSLYTGNQYALTVDEQEKLPTSSSFRVETYRTWIPEELAAYRDTMNAFVNGISTMHSINRLPLPEKEGYLILLEWYLTYRTD